MILLLAGVMQIIMAIVVLIAMINALNEVKKGYCEERYVSCTADSDGSSCAYYGTDSMCYKYDVDQPSQRAKPGALLP